MSVFIGNKEFLDCTECSRCKPRDGLKHGVRYGICGMGGNLVYLESVERTENMRIRLDHHQYLVVVFMRRNEQTEIYSCDSGVDK